MLCLFLPFQNNHRQLKLQYPLLLLKFPKPTQVLHEPCQMSLTKSHKQSERQAPKRLYIVQLKQKQHFNTAI